MLENITVDDALMLGYIINEWYRASLGDFERIFPRGDAKGGQMMPFVDSSGGDGLSMCPGHVGSPRYYDVLIHQFLRKYSDKEIAGVRRQVIESEHLAGVNILTNPAVMSKVAQALRLMPAGIRLVYTTLEK